MKSVQSLLVAAGLLMLCSLPASAASCALSITAPCTITANGSYLLGTHLIVTSMPSWSSYGQYETPIIEIAAGVTQATINCNGYRIMHNGAPYVAEGIGVGGKLNANVHVTNCQFGGTGLMMCTMFDNAANWAYQNIKVDYNYCSGTWQGIFVQSHGAVITDNIVDNIGGHANCASGIYTYGIQLYGGYSAANDPARIERNRVRHVWNPCGNEVVGISMSGYGQRVNFTDNVVENWRIHNAASIAMWYGWSSAANNYSGNKIDRWYRGYLAGYPPLYGPATLQGTALMTNVTVPLFGFDTPPTGIWAITP